MATQTYANLAAQIVALRARVGQCTSTEILADAEATECLNAAMRELNRMRPVLSLLSFTASSGKQRYTPAEVGIPSNAIAPIKKVFWRGGSTVPSPLVMLSSFPNAWAWALHDLYNNDLSRIVVNESALNILTRNFDVIQRYFGGKGWQERDGNVWLDPIPTGACTVYYFAKLARVAAPEDVEDDYSEVLMDLAEWRCCLMLAAKQSEVAGISAGWGKRVQTSGGRIYLQMARDAEKRAFGWLSQIPKLYHV